MNPLNQEILTDLSYLRSKFLHCHTPARKHLYEEQEANHNFYYHPALQILSLSKLIRNKFSMQFENFHGRLTFVANNLQNKMQGYILLKIWDVNIYEQGINSKCFEKVAHYYHLQFLVDQTSR